MPGMCTTAPISQPKALPPCAGAHMTLPLLPLPQGAGCALTWVDYNGKLQGRSLLMCRNTNEMGGAYGKTAGLYKKKTQGGGGPHAHLPPQRIARCQGGGGRAAAQR